MATASKEDILAFKTTDIESVPAPELGEGKELKLRAVSGAEMEEWRERIKDKGTGKVPERELMARMIALCLCDDAGTLMFPDGDAASVNKLPAKLLRRLFPVAQQQAGIPNDEKEDLAEKSEGSLA